MFQALYRKWRPRTFDEVVGQKHVTDTLKTQVAANRLSHAYLFVGSRGTGKTTCARILARAVNCLSPIDGNPCGECAACKAILSGSAPELVEIDAASNNGVDDVRALRDEAVYSPASLKKRVYIIDEVHMLSKPAFNALLKILEEPPEHLLFILATTEINKVPATILSRCQRYSFRRISNEDISNYLVRVADAEGLNLTPDAASLISGLSEGGMRDALSILDQCSSSQLIDENCIMSMLGLSGSAAILQLFKYIQGGDIRNAVSLFTQLWSDGRDPASIIRDLYSFFRDMLICLTCGDASQKLLTGRLDYSALLDASSGLSVRDICGKMELIGKHLSAMRDAASPRQAGELCLISLCLSNSNDAYPCNTHAPNLEASKTASVSVEIPVTRLNATETSPNVMHVNAPHEEVPATFNELSPKEIVPPVEASETESAVGNVNELSSAEAMSADRGPEWENIVKIIEPVLPPTVKSMIHDREKIIGVVDGSVLKITVCQSFAYPRLNSQPVLQSITDTLFKQYGETFRVLVSEKTEEREAPRDINELKKFDNVKFE